MAKRDARISRGARRAALAEQRKQLALRMARRLIANSNQPPPDNVRPA
jgi:hypothetical protein